MKPEKLSAVFRILLFFKKHVGLPGITALTTTPVILTTGMQGLPDDTGSGDPGL